MSERAERTLYLVLSSLAFLYVLARAVLVPFVHDEAATFQTYVLTGNYLPWLAHWDAGNHLLITAIGRACYLLFGSAPVSLRAFAVVSFALYALYAWRLTRPIANNVVRQCAAFALLLTPFNIEFFSLFRGYGPSLAFLLMALHHTLRYVSDGGRKHMVWSLVALTLGSLASLSLVIMHTLLLGVLVLYALWKRDGASMLLCVLGAVPLVFAVIYGRELADRALLYFGTEEGLVKGSLFSLGRWVIGGGVPGAISLLMIAMLGVVAAILHKRTALILLLTLIAGEWLGRIVLGKALGVLYPQDRTAMHWIPVLILIAVFALDGLSIRSASLRWLALLLLLLPLRMMFHANLGHTTYWPEQALPPELFKLVAERQARSDRPLLVGGYRQNPDTWLYGAAQQNVEVNFMDMDDFPQPLCDLMVIDTPYFGAPHGFKTVFAAKSGCVNLMEREAPMRTNVIADSTWSVAQRDDEFTGLWPTAEDEIRLAPSLLEVDALLRSTEEVLRLRVVVEIKDSTGNLLHYDVNDIERMHPHWDGDRLHVLRRVPSFKGHRVRTAVYLWNPTRQSFSVDRLRVRWHSIEE